MKGARNKKAPEKTLDMNIEKRRGDVA